MCLPFINTNIEDSDELSDTDDSDDIIVIIPNTDNIIKIINKIEDTIKDGNEVSNIYLFISSENEDYLDIIFLIKLIYEKIKIISEID